MLINVWVKDKHSGSIHQVGTDNHDSLVVIDGEVRYYNLQNGDGSSKDGGYEIIEPPNLDDYIGITPAVLYLNHELIHNDLIKVLKQKVK